MSNFIRLDDGFWYDECPITGRLIPVSAPARGEPTDECLPLDEWYRRERSRALGYDDEDEE